MGVLIAAIESMRFKFLKLLLKQAEPIRKLADYSRLSIFQSTVGVKIARLIMRFQIVPILFLSTISLAQQQELTQGVNREALFTRAFKSVSYILLAKRNDPTIVKNFTSDELRMLDGIIGVSLRVNLFNWLLENKVAKFGTFGQPEFRYVVSEDRIMTIRINNPKPTRLQFSSDQSLFELLPGQAVRTGMTHATLESDIFINQLKINSAEINLDFASAISLMIHEFGHKLAAQKNQPAVDSLAAKIELLVRSETSSVTLNNKKVTFLTVPRSPVMQLFSSIIYGLPGQSPTNPLLSLDQQGLYAWIEDDKKVTDVTESLVKAFGRSKNMQILASKNFDYPVQTVIIPHQVTAISNSDGSIKFTISGLLNKFSVPFIKYKLSDPVKEKIYATSFLQKTNAFEKCQQQEISLSPTDYSLLSVATTPMSDELTGVDIKFLRKEMNGTDLEIFFKIDGDLGLQYPTENELWPEIKIRVQGNALVIKATSVDKDKKIYKFVIKNFEKLSHQNVHVETIQMRTKKFVLPIGDYDMVWNTFFPAEIPLSISQSNAITTTNKPVLKSIQIWDGKGWISYKNKNKIPSGYYLRFVFKSDENLRQVVLNQGFQASVEVRRKSMFTARPSYETTETEQRQLIFEETSFRQTRHGEFIYVDINIDHETQTEYVDEIPWVYHGALPGQEPPPDADLQIHKAGPVRTLNGYFHFVTDSGSSGQVLLKNEVTFMNSGDTTIIPPNVPRLKTGRRARCEGLF